MKDGMPPVVLCVVRAPEDSALSAGASFPVRNARCVLGRSPDADVVLADRTVSRQHARIDVGDSVTVSALTSSNGTFVNRGVVEPGTPVVLPSQGAELQLGGVVLDVVILAETAPVLEPVGAALRARSSGPLLTVVWDGGQCAARCGQRDLGLTGVAARFLGQLADRPGEVVHYWDLQQELKTSHLAPLATSVRQALQAALTSGALDDARVRTAVQDLTGQATADMPGVELMRGLVQVRRGHGYVINLVPPDLVFVRI